MKEARPPRGAPLPLISKEVHMNVSELLTAPAACRKLTVRSVSPMAVVVLELEAPARLETQTYSAAEFAALLRWLREDEIASEVIRSYAAGRLDAFGEDDFAAIRREDAHRTRLESEP